MIDLHDDDNYRPERIITIAFWASLGIAVAILIALAVKVLGA